MLAPILATNPSTPASPARYGLWLDGLDVIREPATSGLRRWGARAESVDLRVAGSGGVSSMSFTISDPTGAVTVADGMTVRLHDHVNDIPMFYGWIDHFETRLLGIGREIEVAAIGADALLDWAVTDYDVTLKGFSGAVPADQATLQHTGIASLVAACGGIGELRVSFDPANPDSTYAHPIEELLQVAFPNDVVIPAGVTLREGIARMAAAASQPLPAGSGATNQVFVWVDPTLGLRVIADDGSPPGRTGDGTNLIIGTASLRKPTQHEYAIDATAVVRAVRVVGTGATATVTDGTGKRGRKVVIRDTSLTTVDQCANAGATYLAGYSTAQRGSITDEDCSAHSPAWVIASGLTITDDQLGATGTYRIAAARWRLYGAKRDVTFEYGAMRGSAASMLRRLTRDTLN